MNFNHYSRAVDERGECIALSAAELQRRLGTRMAPDKVMAYAVNTMGWVGLAETDATIEVHYERAVVSHLSLIGVMNLIWNANRPIVIREVAGQPTLARTAATAIAHLSALVEFRKRAARFWRSQVAVERSPFARLMPTAMEIIFSDIEIDTQHRLLDCLLDHRYSINRLDASNGHYKSLRISDGIAGFDRDFAKNKLGDTYHSFVDPEFGVWMADCFAEMSPARCARVEEVGASFINGPRLGKVSYTRLLMPFERLGDKFLLVASDVPE